MENRWLSLAKRLHALAHSGLAYNPEPYDKERYEEIALLAEQMLSGLADEPLSKIQNLIVPSEKKYVTPQVDVRGAIFSDNKILLVREKSDGKWTLPGGYADTGLTARQNIEKEVQEEAGLTVMATKLFAVRHKASGDYRPDVQDIYKLFFLCHCDQPELAKPGLETSEVGFYNPNHLPELSSGRTIARDIEDAFQAKNDEYVIPIFD